MPTGKMTAGAVAAVLLALSAAAAEAIHGAGFAMPMLCFPQCLFAGAIVPVPIMAAAGKAMSALMSNRWSFEGLGYSAGLRETVAGSNSPGAEALLAQYGSSFSGPVTVTWLILSAFTIALMLATCFVLQRKSRGN